MINIPEYISPDCAVCGRSMPKIKRPEAGKKPTLLKRTCPSCHRRFLIKVEMKTDLRYTLEYERIYN